MSLNSFRDTMTIAGIRQHKWFDRKMWALDGGFLEYRQFVKPGQGQEGFQMQTITEISDE